MFPCQSRVFDARPGELDSLMVSMLAAGSHLTALATAGAFASAHYTTSRTLRRAMTFSMMTMTALMCALHVRQIVQQGGWTCSRSPILLPLVALLLGWVAYAAISRTRGGL